MILIFKIRSRFLSSRSHYFNDLILIWKIKITNNHNLTSFCDLDLENQDKFHFWMSQRFSIAEARLCDILKLFYGSDMEWSLNWRKQSTFSVTQTGQARTRTTEPNQLTWGENWSQISLVKQRNVRRLGHPIDSSTLFCTPLTKYR